MGTEFEKKWLVKSDQKILGPYSYEQVEALLKKKQISLIDEIRDTDRRWLFIREVPELKDMVEVIRKEIENMSEMTQTIQTKTNQTTRTLTKSEVTQAVDIKNESKAALKTQSTDLDVEAHDDDDEIDNQDSEYSDFNKLQKENLEIVDVQFKEDKLQKTDNLNSKVQALRYGLKDDSRIEEETKLYGRWIMLALALVVLAVVGGIFSYLKIKANEVERMELDQVNLVKKHAFIGNNEKVIEGFSQLKPALQLKVIPSLIPYFPILQNYGVSSSTEAIVKLIKTNNFNTFELSQLELVQFLRTLTTKDVLQAKRHLVNAKDLTPQSDLVLENEALFHLEEGEYKEAYSLFKSLNKKELKGRWLFGQLLAQFLNNDFIQVDEQLDQIGRHLTTRSDFKRELLLFQAYLAKKESKKRLFESSIKDYIEAPSQFNSFFRQNPLIYSRFYVTNQTEKVYLKIIAKPVDIDLDRSLQSFSAAFALENMRYDEVLNYLKSENLNPKNLFKQDLNLQYLLLQGRGMEAVAFIKTIDVSKLNLYSQFLIFKFLTEKNEFKIQMEEVYKSVSAQLFKESSILSRYVQFTLLKQNNPKELQEFLELNLVLYSDFIPFLKAKSELM